MLSYTGETIINDDGVECAVLDKSSVDFTGAAEGRKTAETLVRRAEGGEEIHTRNSEGQIESTYVAKEGDAIFINLHNFDDIYVPGNDDGSRWQFSELEQRGYEIVGDDQENGGVRVKNTQTSRILHEVIDRPTCIKDSWGEGAHAFLYEGATLKDNGGGRVTGIDKEAFDNTWEITKAATNVSGGQTFSPRNG